MIFPWYALTSAWSERIWIKRVAPRHRKRIVSSAPEQLESRTLLSSYAIPVSVDGMAFDRNRDGVFEGVITSGTTLPTSRSSNPAIGDERAVYEFDISSVPSSELILSVILHIDFSDVAVRTGLDYSVTRFFGGIGDGAITVSDVIQANTPIRDFVLPLTYAVPAKAAEALYDISLSPSFFQSRLGSGTSVSIVSQMLTLGCNLTVNNQENVAITPTLRPQLLITTTTFSAENTSVSLTVTPNSIEEDAGPNAGTLTVTRTGNYPGVPLSLSLLSTDSSEATVPATVLMPANVSSVQVGITAVDDDLLDGTQTAKFVSIVSQPLNGPGNPIADQEFGGENGILVPGAGGSDDSTYLNDTLPQIVVQPDGKSISLLANLVYPSETAGQSWKLTRLNLDGTYDTTFGTNGVVTTSLPNVHHTVVSGLTLQTDGKIVIAGSSYASPGGGIDWFLARYLPNGTLDPTFGSDGFMRDPVIPNDAAAVADVVQLPDGKLLVSGIRTVQVGANKSAAYSVSRYLSTGTPDPTFGVNGTVTYDAIAGFPESANGMVVQSDGKIVVVGTGHDSSDVGILRLNADGSLDNGFGSGGFVSVNLGPDFDAVGESVTIQPDGKIVVAARTLFVPVFRRGLAVIRLTTNGSLDNTFSSDGFDIVVSNTPVFGERAYSVTLQSDGRILVAGDDILGGITTPTLYRFLTDGTRDVTFGDGGFFFLRAASGLPIDGYLPNSNNGASFYSMAWQPDGRLVALASSPRNVSYVVRFSSGVSSFSATSNVLQVTDHESLSVTSSRASISESAGPNAAFGTVTRTNTNIGFPLVVTLVSSDPTESTVPLTITIPANASTAQFMITAIDDALPDDNQTVTFTASATGYVPGSRSIVVNDDEVTGSILPGDILVTRPGAVANSYEIAEFTPTGTFVHAITIPWGGPAARPPGEAVHDLIQDQLGRVYIYNGTSAPYLTSYNPADQTFGSHNFAGWSSNLTSGAGGVATFHQFVFATDSDTATGSAAGIVRFDRSNNSVLRLANPLGYQDLAVGLDRLLYALNQNQHIDVYDPVTLSLIRSLDLPAGDYRGLAVKADGEILAAGANGTIYLFDSNGGLKNSIASGAAFLTDIDIGPGGRVVAGSLAGEVIITNTNLAAPTKFSASTTEAFVAFAFDASFPGPTIHTSPTPQSLLESDVPTSIDPAVLVTNEGTDLVGATIRFSSGYFPGSDQLAFTNQNGIIGQFDFDAGTLTLEGAASVANYQAALRSVGYSTRSDTPTASRTVTFSVTDGVNSASATRNVTLTSVNDPPFVNTSQVFFVPENSLNNVTLGTVTGYDPDSAGLTGFTIVSGNSTNLFDLNPVTGILRVVDGSQLDFESRRQYILGVTVSDGSLTSEVQTITVNVTDENDHVPVITPGQTFVAAENSPNSVVLGKINATDIDTVGTLQVFAIVSGNVGGVWSIDSATGQLSVANGSQLDFEATKSYVLGIQVSDGIHLSATQTIQINLSDQNDVAPVVTPGLTFSVPENSLNNTPAGMVTAIDVDTFGMLQNYAIASGNASGAWHIDPISGLITVNLSSPLDFETTPVFILGVTVSDGLHTSAIQDVNINLTNVNESPSLPPSVFTISESSTGGLVVGTIQGIDPDAGQQITYTITAGNTGNAFSLDPNSGVITVINGAVFDFETTPSYSFIVTVTDNGTPQLLGSGLITINLTNGNDFPVITPNQSFFVTENSPNTTIVGTVDAHDPDNGQLVSYSITNGNSSGAFAINPLTGLITVADSSKVDFESTSTYSLTIKVTDSGGPPLSATGVVIIHVNNVNETPTLAPATFSLTENSPKNTVVGVVAGQDPDIGQSLSYTIAGGNTGSAFSVQISTGMITINTVSAVDFETNPTFALTVKVQDNGSPNLSSTTTITINLTNILEAPSFVNQLLSINEGSTTGATVGTVLASDPDQHLPLTYVILSGNEQGTFALNSVTGVLTVANAAGLDYETQPFIPLQISVTKPGAPPLTTTATVTINVGDVNEAPVPDAATFSIDENSPATTSVGMLAATDPDFGQSLTYSIVGGNTNAAFLIDADTGAIRVADVSVLDFETIPNYSLSIQITDSGFPPQSTIGLVTIHLNDVNDPPVLNDQSMTIAENTAVGTVMGTMTATDPDASQQLTYSITGGNSNNSFAIDPVSGQVSVINNAVLNFEAQTQFVLIVRVIDNGQPAKFDTGSLTINLADINEPPHLNPVTFTLAENSPVGTVVGTILAIDEEGNQHTTYAVTAADLDGLFAISPNGQLTIAQPNLLDFETHPVIHLTVTTFDDGTPSASESKQFTVQLTNVDEPPEIVLTPGVRTLSIPVKPQAFDPQAIIRDVDTPNFSLANTTLQVKVIDHASASDRVQMLKSKSGDLVVKGRSLLYQGTLIGLMVFGKKGGVPLTVNFNGAATQAGVDAVLQKIYYRTKGASGSVRTLEFSLSGLAGGQPSKTTKIVRLA